MKILIVDDDESMRWVMVKAIEKRGYEVYSLDSGEAAVEFLKTQSCSVVFMDIKMAGISGLEALREIKKIRESIYVVVMTAQNDMKNAIDAMKLGAFDYIGKPFDLNEIYLLIEKIRGIESLKEEVTQLRSELKRKSIPESLESIIGESREMQEVFKLIGRVADKDVTVLITGESGTGKELIAKVVHYNSRRISKPFVVINCAAIPETLLESELFGHEKGAFTDATTLKVGKFQQADGGTLFLDEIGDMGLDLQAKLLRVLQDGDFYRVGGSKPINANVRIIAATNKNLEEIVQAGLFREDLYYRLNVINIHLPPLRERKNDINLLIEHFLNKFPIELGIERKHISREAENLLIQYQWPGNIRELENVLKRAVVLTTTDTITPEHLPLSISRFSEPADKKKIFLEDLIEARLQLYASKLPPDTEGDLYEMIIGQVEKSLIEKVIRKTSGNQIQAARILGINRNTLRKKIQELGVEL
jgi:two-component system nitrogen regulation response regulator GlnG